MGKKPSLSPANAHGGSTTHKARNRRRCCCHRADETWPSETDRGATRARRVGKTTLPITAHPRPNRCDYASRQSPERRRLDRLGHGRPHPRILDNDIYTELVRNLLGLIVLLRLSRVAVR